jgi:glycosyltransferase involved in cell wall biosynthesis
MHIGFIYGPSYPPTSGGTIHGYQLVRELHALGHRISNWYFDYGANPLIEHWQGRRLRAFLKSIDVLYLRIEWRLSPAICTLMKGIAGKRLPVVWELNGTPYETLFNEPPEDPNRIIRRLRWLSAGCDAAIAVSEEIAEFATRELHVRKTYTIPNGSDETMFRPGVRTATPGKPLAVVWVGTSAAGWHDLDALIDTARETEHRRLNIRYAVFGDPRHLRSSLPPNVVAAGVVCYEDLGRAIGVSDVGLHLFKSDPQRPQVVGSPLKVFDYMASGLAVVTNAEGQQSRLIRQWNAGVQTTGTVTDLVETLSRLERDRVHCELLGRNGRRAVETYFNWHRVARETEAALAETFGARSSN